MTMDKIYILKKKKFVSGPYSYSEIKNRGLRSHEKVWYEGLQDWISADQDVAFSDLVRKGKGKVTILELFTLLFSSVKSWFVEQVPNPSGRNRS